MFVPRFCMSFTKYSQFYEEYVGKNREKVSKITSGDIGAAVKLKNTHTNNTLNSPKVSDDIIEPIVFPAPKYRVAVGAKNLADEEKLNVILQTMHKMDQTLTVEYSKELKQLILGGQGELHLNIIKWQIENLEKILMEFYAPKIPYRETITRSAKATYRHKKQSGGAGQFGEVYMMIEPYTEGMEYTKEFPIRGTDEIELEWGGKLIMKNSIVGGAIDARFLPAILKGVMEKMEEGPLTGSYARDIVFYVYDGKMHPVDSNEISFKLAGRHAFKEAFKNAGPQILEPIYDVEVLVPEDRMGDVMTDLQGRRAIIMGMGAEGNYQKINAKVPLAEMNKYSTALSVAAGGKINAIVVDNDITAQRCIEFLRENRLGTCMFIPLNKIKPRRLELRLKSLPGVIDFAINLVKFDEKFHHKVKSKTNKETHPERLQKTPGLAGYTSGCRRFQQ